MNLFALNGETLNGSPSMPLGAAAAIAGTVAVDPSATRNVFASASIVGVGGFTGTANLNGALVADVGGSVSLDGTPRHTQAAIAQLDLYAGVTASVYRLVPTTLDIACTASFSVIPASILGAANVVGNSGLSATATKVQPGSAAMPGAVGITAAPFVTRRVSASVQLNGNLRPEAQKNKAVDAFVDIVGNVNLAMPDSGIVLRQAGAYLALANDLTARATYTQTGYAVLDNAGDFTANGVVMSVPFAASVGSVSFVANATRIVQPAAAFTNTCAVAAKMVQAHAGAVSAVQSADVVANPVLIQVAAANVNPSASINAVSTKMRTAAALMDGHVNLVARLGAMNYASASVTGTVAVSAQPTRLVLAAVDGVVTADFVAMATAAFVVTLDIAPTADLSLAPATLMFTVLDITPSASLDFNIKRTTFGAVQFGLVGTVRADGRLNIEAYDPPERTLYRPFIDTEVARPFVDTEMRRAA